MHSDKLNIVAIQNFGINVYRGGLEIKKGGGAHFKMLLFFELNLVMLSAQCIDIFVGLPCHKLHPRPTEKPGQAVIVLSMD